MVQTENKYGLRDGEVIFRHHKENTGFGDKPLIYNLETGVCHIGEDEIDGDELIHLAEKIQKSRVHAGLDKEERAGRGFVATQLDAAGILKEQLDAAWRNLPLYYPENQRDDAERLIAEARAQVDKDV